MTAARQLDALGRAERTALLVDRVIARAWRQLLGRLEGTTWQDAEKLSRDARNILRPIRYQLNELIRLRLIQIARWGHSSAVEAVLSLMPVRLQRRAVARLSEDISSQIRDLVIPPPSLGEIESILFHSGYQETLSAFTRLLDPDAIGSEVFASTARAESIRDLAKRLLPVLDGVRATARRVARDTSMYVAHSMQMRAWDAVGELIVGYQIHAVDGGHSPTSRPEHKARHGTRYWKQPEPGQNGLDEMPRPPFESPRDGNTLAWNCRCFLSPIFRAD